MLEVGLQLLLLALKLILHPFFTLAILIGKDFDLCLKCYNLLFIIADLAGKFVLKVIYESLPAIELAFALLIVDSQILVLNLDLIEQALNLAEVVRMVLLCEGLSKSFDFLFEPLILHL